MAAILTLPIPPRLRSLRLLTQFPLTEEKSLTSAGVVIISGLIKQNPALQDVYVRYARSPALSTGRSGFGARGSWIGSEAYVAHRDSKAAESDIWVAWQGEPGSFTEARVLSGTVSKGEGMDDGWN